MFAGGRTALLGGRGAPPRVLRRSTVPENDSPGRDSSARSPGDSTGWSERNSDRDAQGQSQRVEMQRTASSTVPYTYRSQSTTNAISPTIAGVIPQPNRQQSPQSYGDPTWYTTRPDNVRVENSRSRTLSSPLPPSGVECSSCPQPQNSPVNDAIDSSYRHPSSHRYYANPNQYLPPRSAEYPVNATSLSTYPISSNVLHHYGIETPQMPLQSFNSGSNQTQGAGLNYSIYKGPIFAEVRWNFQNSDGGHLQEEPYSPRSSRREADGFPQSYDLAYQTGSGTSETRRSDDYHLANALRPIQSPPEHLCNNCSTPNVIGDGNTPQYLPCSIETCDYSHSSLSTTMSYTEPLYEIESTSASSLSDDDGASSSYMPSQSAFNTGINLNRLRQTYDKNAFQWDVNVWQKGVPENAEFLEEFRDITLLFDTQCEGSNWVAAPLVKALGAKVKSFSPAAEFIGFTGHTISTSRRTTLTFKNRRGGSRYTADFLVSDVDEAPFDMLLGASDIQRLGLIRLPHIRALVAVSKLEKKDAEKREAEAALQAQVVEKNDRKVQRHKAKKKEEKKMREQRHK